MRTKNKNIKQNTVTKKAETRHLEKITQIITKKIKSEFTSRGTPQQNGVVERGFSTLYIHMRAMMVHMGPHENINTGLCTKCAETNTNIENIMVNPYEEKCAHEKFYGKIPDNKNYLRTFG